MKDNHSLKGLSRNLFFSSFFKVDPILPLFITVGIFLFSFHGNAQQSVSLSVRNQPIAEVFRLIEEKTNYAFFFDENLKPELTKKVTVEAYSMPVSQILGLVLAPTNLTFRISGRQILVFKKSPISRGAKKEEITRTITGRVTSQDGEILPGVNVLIKGTQFGVTTNAEGYYSLPVPVNSEVVLSFSFIGMESVDVEVESQSVINVTLKENLEMLSEVVVTGYQVIDKRALTSAITSVKAEDIMRPDAFTLDQMLEGHIPDMMFISNSGEVGAVPKIRIRGTSSIIGNREPLWVVDGIVVQDPVPISPEELNNPDYVNRIGNAIAGLNPQDIERLDILKDASATTLYGSKAANGVIVIATKRGRVGKPQIRYSNNFNYKLRPRYTDRSVDVMNSKERIQFSRELFRDHYRYESTISPVGYEGLLMDLYAGKINDAEFATKVGVLETMNTDWFDLLTHDSFSQQHTISMNGGSEDGRYYASIGYTDMDDVVNDTDNKRYSAILNLDTNFTPWLSVSFGLKGNVSKRNYYQDEIAPVQYAYTASRAIPAYTPDGKYNFYDKMVQLALGYDYNILNELENSSVNQDGSSITLDTNFRFNFSDWLSANAIASYTAQTTDIGRYWGDRTWHMANLRRSNYGEEIDRETTLAPQGGELTSDHTRQNNWTVRLQLDWNKYLGEAEKHNFNGGVGFEASSNRYRGHVTVARGYYPDRGLSFVEGIDLSKYPAYSGWMANNVPRVTDDLSNVMSGYLTMTYSYNRMVYLNGNARVDGSNRFGDQNNSKLLPIWSVSTSFNFSELPWMKQFDNLDYLTMKTSYGFQGNMISEESPVMIIKKNPMNDYYNEYTASAQRNPNPNLKWERTNSYNIGAEASFFDRRIQLEASVYFKRTKDAFMTKTVSTVNGYESYVVNGGNIANDGYSVSATLIPIKNKDWNWSLSASFSRTLNEIKTLPAGEEYELNNFLTGSAVVKGKPVGTFYSYRFLGLSPVDGGPLFDDWGDHWDDLLGLSKYDTYTRVLEASGTREPYMSGGLTSIVRYKNFRLNSTFVYSLGAKTRLFSLFGADASSAEAYSANDIRPEWNVSREYLNRWQKPGDESHTNIPAIIGNGHGSYERYQQHWSQKLDGEGVQPLANNYWDMYDYSDIRVVSANYLKCSNIGLTYEVPKDWLKMFALTRLEVNVSGSNLFTISDRKLKGQTPTQGGFTTIQLSDRPSFSFGLNLTF